MNAKFKLTIVSVVLACVPLLTHASSLFYIDSTGNVGINNSTPADKLDISGAYHSRLVNLTSSSTIAVDWSSGNVQALTLGTDPTLTFSSGQAGGQYTLIVNQDGTGGRNITWPGSVKWPGGNSPVLSTAASSTDLINFTFDGSNYLGTFNLNFLAAPPSAPAIVGSVTTYASSVSTTTHTISATVPSGSNECLIAIAVARSGNSGAITSATWNGNSMSQVVSVTGGNLNGGIVFYLAAPTTGTHDLVLTTAGTDVNASVFTLAHCAQSSPIDVTSSDLTSSSGTSQSGSITTTVNNDLVISWITINTSGSSISDNGGQSSVSNFTGSSWAVPFAVSTVTKSVAGSQSMGYTWTGSVSNEMFITSIKPAP